MKDLLLIQKKIRSILEEWLSFCRNSLSILEPDLYILPDFPSKHRVTRFNENHSDYEKIVFYRRKSKSADNLTFRRNISSSLAFSGPESGRLQTLKKNILIINSEDSKVLDDARSKSAFISNYFCFFICLILTF